MHYEAHSAKSRPIEDRKGEGSSMYDVHTKYSKHAL